MGKGKSKKAKATSALRLEDGTVISICCYQPQGETGLQVMTDTGSSQAIIFPDEERRDEAVKCLDKCFKPFSVVEDDEEEEED